MIRSSLTKVLSLDFHFHGDSCYGSTEQTSPLAHFSFLKCLETSGAKRAGEQIEQENREKVSNSSQYVLS